ncbi:AAA family ATPase [Deinococcus pimensis]|uniref:AAA family ATPase n=1 Tax=Deinococcus pimensis TaxID=309888 RepID=UPI0004B48A0D|nr:AAA family ATPase [Deinococcus pimensis]
MLTIHLLGHAHVTLHGRTFPISAKAVALIAYLALEKVPQHRERLADLLWNTAEARKNLRVELARIRSAGLNIFPASRQLLYLENVVTDFEVWRDRLSHDMNEVELSSWLTTLRGLPLSGLEDLGNATFQEWVEQQRWMLSQQVEQCLRKAYWRFARENHVWATRMIAARAEALGFENPADAEMDDAPLEPERTETPAPVTSLAPRGPRPGVPHFERPLEEQALLHRLERAREVPQLVVLHGEPGSGKTYLTERLARRVDGLTVRVAHSSSGRLMLATLAQALLPVSDADCAEALGRVLLHPSTLDEDVVKIGVALSRLAKPVLVVVDHAHHAPQEAAPLLDYLLRVPASAERMFVLLSRELPTQAPLTRVLTRGLDRAACLDLALPPLTQQSVQRALEQEFPFEPARRLQTYATRLLQSSGGNPLRVLSLLEQGDLRHVTSAHIPPAVRERYDAETETWPAALHDAMSALSVVAGRFDRDVAHALLAQHDHRTVDRLMEDALARRILVEAGAVGALRWPALDEEPPLVERPGYRFVNEGLRVTLSGRLPQFTRQALRARLADVLAQDAPGIAGYYAERAGLRDLAETLRRRHRDALPADHPLARVCPGTTTRPTRGVAPEPARGQSVPRPPAQHAGYLVATEEGTWLGIRSEGRYGHPDTLTLRFTLPAVNDPDAELTLHWRLDVYGDGRELAPDLAPFPLRLRAANAGTAHVLTPEPTPTYVEDGLTHHVHDDAGLGYWMEYRLRLTPEELAARTLELDVRALDVALTIASLRWGEHELLTFGAPQGVPTERERHREASAWTERPLLTRGREHSVN